MEMTYRQKLINTLIKLQTDEFNPSEVMYFSNKDIIESIIECAHYYKNECN